MDYEVEGERPRSGPKKTWSEVIEKDCQSQQTCKEDTMDHRKWRKLITCYLLLVVVGLEKLDALNAPLFTSVESILERVDRLRHDH